MELNSDVTIRLANVRNNETFTFSVIIVKGCISGDLLPNAEDKISVKYIDQQGNVSRKSCFKLIDKKFSLLLRLEPGNNDFLIEYQSVRIKQSFYHVLPSVKYVVSPMFIICDGEEIPYRRIEIIKDKIYVGCNLIQTLIAEILYEYGFGRRTFVLEQGNTVFPIIEHGFEFDYLKFQISDDANGNGGCLIFYSKLNIKTASTMSSEELWEYFGREIMTSEYGFKHRKFLSFLSCGEGNICQNLAIGGGGLALCSAEYLRTWPNSIDDINNFFSNEITPNFSHTNHVKYAYYVYNFQNEESI